MKINAYAKINLTLDVISKRADGYHLLDSVMQIISLHDTVNVKKNTEISVFCDNSDITGENNLAFTAAKEFFSATGKNGGAKIKIKKRIPLAAGLGGGSSDAAAVIVALDRLYGTNLSRERLLEIALKVGADVPFLIFGGIARAEGIGEKITPLKNNLSVYAVLCKADQKQSTGEMYKKLDSIQKGSFHTESFVASLYSQTPDYTAVSNDFSSVFENTELLNAIKKTSPLAVSLSGSGPTYFALYRTRSLSKAAAKVLKNSGFTPIVTKFV